MPTDVNFDFTWVPNRYADRLQRSAVLYPLMGKASSAAHIAEQAAALQFRWRARLYALNEHGWLPRNHDLGGKFARNCLPAFAYAIPRMLPCGNTSLCPFCYARWVRAIWEAIDRQIPNPRTDCNTILPATDRRQVDELLGEQGLVDDGERNLRAISLDTEPREYPYHVLSHFKLFKFPYKVKGQDVTPEERLRALLEQAMSGRGRSVRRQKARGAFIHMTVEPTKHGWLFRSRELYLIDKDAPTPEARQGKIHRCTQPTRGAVLQALIRVCRYPTLLVAGDPARTAVLLRARQGTCLHKPPLRMSATYGCFRNRRG